MIQGLIAPSFFDFWFSQVLGARGMAVRLSLFPGGGGVGIQGLVFAHWLPLLGALLFPTPLPKSRSVSGIEIQLPWSWISAAMPKARSLNPLANPNPKIITPQTVRRKVPEG